MGGEKHSDYGEGRKNSILHNAIHIHTEPVDEARFQFYFSKLFSTLTKMEESKYLPPKFSECAQELASMYGLVQGVEA